MSKKPERPTLNTSTLMEGTLRLTLEHNDEQAILLEHMEGGTLLNIGPLLVEAREAEEIEFHGRRAVVVTFHVLHPDQEDWTR